MQLELRDLTSSQSILVPEEGLTFGRQGGDANVLLGDMGVSKRHARIWGEGGAWFLEDLGSSNGTYVQSERIKEAVEILPGDVFQMSKVKMEVVQVVDGAQNGAATFGDMPAADPNDIDPPEEREPTPRPQARPVAAKAPAKAAAKSAPPVSAKKPSKASPPPAEERGGKKPNSGTQATNMPDDAAVDRSIGYFFVAVPKAVAYYLANIPLLLVNPIGRVRKIIEEQPADPMGRMELIAYAIPPLVIQQVLPSLAVGIVLAVHGTISIMSFIPIVPLIVAVISAVISGFIWHPFVKWVVNFLKGESDERSRTNYFLMTMTANAVLAVPTFVATMLGLIPFRLVAIVGVLLSLVASLAILFVHWSWFTYFNVVKWFRTVLLVVGALSVLGGLASGVMLLINGNGGVSTTTTTIAVGDGTNGLTAEQQAQIDAAQKQADAMMKQAGAANGDAADQIKAMQEKAQEQIKAAQAAGKDAQARTAKAVEDAKADVKAAQNDAKANDTKANDEKVAPPPVEKVDNTPVETAHVASGNGYPAWHSKYEAIEKRVTDDPTVLKNKAGVENLYRSLTEQVYDIEAKYAKQSKKPSELRLQNHLKDAELYEKTDKTVQELYNKIK